MLFTRPVSILQSNTNQYFMVEHYHLFISDRYERAPIQLLGKRLIDENLYYPFVYFRSRYPLAGYPSLLLFAGLGSSHLIVWKVNHKLPLEYIDQFQIPLSDLSVLLTLTDSSLEDLQQCVLRSAINAPDKFRDTLTSLASNLCGFSEIQECLSANLEYQQLLKELFNPYIFSINTSIEGLVNFIDHNIESSQARQIMSLFDGFIARIGQNFDTSFSHIAKYCMLREIFCLVTGKHVVLDPFSSQHLVSECTALCTTTFYDKYPSVKTRLIKYRQSSGHCFIERRGPGWIDASSGIFLHTGFVIDVKTGHQWGPRMAPDEIQVIAQLLDTDLLPDSEEDKQYLICEVVSGDNLGHTLWNEVSGYVEFILLCQAVGWQPERIIPVLPPSIPSRFSKLGVRAHFYPYIQKTLCSHNGNVSNSEIIHRYTESISQRRLPNQIFVKNQVVSFRYPRISKDVVREISHDHAPSKGIKVRIYKNIRFHNKSQNNTPECLDELFCQLSSHTQPYLHPSHIQLDLEFSDRHEPTINKISEICNKYGVLLNLCESYEVPELLQLVASSNICIAPIGSGAVLPTWVFQKPTILHAESAHRGQLCWWHIAGNNDPKLQYLIPGEAIEDDLATAKLAYGNYSIVPEIYAKVVISALSEHVLSTTVVTDSID